MADDLFQQSSDPVYRAEGGNGAGFEVRIDAGDAKCAEELAGSRRYPGGGGFFAQGGKGSGVGGGQRRGDGRGECEKSSAGRL